MKKIAIIYGAAETGVEKRALAALSEILLDYTGQYPYCYRYGEREDLDGFHLIYIGTKGNNPYIAEHSTTELSYPEEYALSVENGVAMIEGYDAAGVLYGCMDYYNKYVVKNEHPDTDRYWINFFERDVLPSFFCTSRPAIRNRGIWTWGHVIYDYRSFIDNMVKLKMNTIVIWNDRVPVNAPDMIAYAHDAGIKVIFGYAWGWDNDMTGMDLTKLSDRSGEILAQYEREYAHLGADGLYFQSATEVGGETIGGVLIADAVTSFVNETAKLFFEKYPDLELQFGLHAKSVKKRLDYIRRVDPRIRIVWENCGGFPFSYIPKDVKGHEETLDFVREIASLRGEDDRFGAVTKGLVKLDWYHFEHPDAPLYVGVSSDMTKERLITRKHRIWKYIQAYWLTNARYAYDAIRVMAEEKGGDLYVTGLVEDGMFEEEIMYPVALYSEMLWDNETPIEDMMSAVALRSYVTFA